MVKDNYSNEIPRALLRRMIISSSLNLGSLGLPLVHRPLAALKVRRPQASLFTKVDDTLTNSGLYHSLTLRMAHTPTAHTLRLHQSRRSHLALMRVLIRDRCPQA